MIHSKSAYGINCISLSTVQDWVIFKVPSNAAIL